MEGERGGEGKQEGERGGSVFGFGVCVCVRECVRV